MSEPSTTLRKNEMRRAVLSQLKAIPAERRNRYSLELRSALSPLLQSPEPLNICLFAPLDHETDLMPLLQSHPQHHYHFPLCLPERKLAFHRVQNPASDLVPGALGIRAPRPELPLLPPAEADIVIVPGVAFTKNGTRLGYGGGYYDRYLPLCSRARIVATAFPEQMQNAIPHDIHDIAIPLILTVDKG